MDESSLRNVHRPRNDYDGRSHENSINRLPDALLCHILSLLPTQEAVLRCVLSRRWRYLWALVPNLCVDYSLAFNGHGYRDCVYTENFVDKVLILGHVLDIKKFLLKTAYKKTYGYDASRINMWVRVAIARNVEELDLHLDRAMVIPEFHLPRILFVHDKLSILKLHGRILFPSLESVLLPKLKTCHLKFLESSTKKCLRLVLSGSPILEELLIHTEWCPMHAFEIRSTSLKSLSIHRLPPQASYNCNVLVIDAPNLEFLKLEDYGSDLFQVSEHRLLNKAYVDVRENPLGMQTEDEYKIAVHQLIRQIARVKNLCLFYVMLW